MKIIKIEPKDVWVTIDFSLKELEKLLKALDHTEVNYDHKSLLKEDIQIKEAAKYLVDEFYPSIKEVVDDLVEDK
jgi:thiazole synthase ThiGH ThiG subunit